MLEYPGYTVGRCQGPAKDTQLMLWVNWFVISVIILQSNSELSLSFESTVALILTLASNVLPVR